MGGHEVCDFDGRVVCVNYPESVLVLIVVELIEEDHEIPEGVEGGDQLGGCLNVALIPVKIHE